MDTLLKTEAKHSGRSTGAWRYTSRNTPVLLLAEWYGIGTNRVTEPLHIYTERNV